MSDCDFPLIREYLQLGHNVEYYISIVNNKRCGGLFNIKSKQPFHGIVCAKNIPEMQIYANYLDLKRVYAVFRSNKLYDWHNWRVYFQLIRRIRRHKADVIHLDNILGLSECLLYIFIRKSILTVHDPFMHSGEYTHLSELKRKIIFHLTPKLILLNQRQRTAFVNHYHLRNKLILNNYLGAYNCLNFLAKHYPINSTSLNNYILFFGHISPYKGIDILCKAMVEVHDILPELHCIIAGRGTLNFDYSPYKNLSYIHFENRFIESDELIQLITHSLFVVCPYKDATQSGVISSAFAFNKPVLATNVGGIGETVENNRTGILIQANDTTALSNAIIQLIKNKQLLNSLSSNIKNLYTNGERSWKQIAIKNIEFYSKKINIK